MKKGLIAFAALVGMVAPAFAHHSAIAEYDLDKPVKISGTSRASSGAILTSGSTWTSRILTAP